MKTFDDNNLPKLGSKVWLVIKDDQTQRSLVKSGLVFAHMIRYHIGPNILVDTTSRTADDMAFSGVDCWTGDPTFIYTSASAAGEALDNQ